MVDERMNGMFIIVRMLFSGLIFALSIVLIHKAKIRKKRFAYIFSAVVAVALICVLALFPFENAFITFKTPEESFKYVYIEPSVKLTVYGENSCLVIGDKSGVNKFLIIPKSEKGWSVDVGSNTKIIEQKIFGSVVICVYKHRNTGDCYISVFDANGRELQLSDGCNSKFIASRKLNDALGKTCYNYYAYVSIYDENYQLMINGELLDFNWDTT